MLWRGSEEEALTKFFRPSTIQIKIRCEMWQNSPAGAEGSAVNRMTEEMNRVYFLCYMIERVARRLHQRNAYVVNQIGREELGRLLDLSDVLHCKNPLKIEWEWVQTYGLEPGGFDITDVDRNLCPTIPTPTQIGKVYMRLIRDTQLPGEKCQDAILRVYNHPICKTIDNYEASAYYEPSYVVARAYYNEGGF